MTMKGTFRGIGMASGFFEVLIISFQVFHPFFHLPVLFLQPVGLVGVSFFGYFEEDYAFSFDVPV
jgi:hypothetical protein